MKIERLSDLPPAPDRAAGGAAADSRRRSVVAVGNFDGVHRGHQAGLALAREEAPRYDAECVGVTFDPHPARLLRPDSAPRTITSFPLKAERLAAAGIERLIVLEFGQAMARTSPEDFVRRLLVGRLHAATVVQGPNFGFGRGRAGDIRTLRTLGARHGFRVLEAPSVSWQGEIVSSTRIRTALASGDLELATTLLGGFYEVEGVVVAGKGRGHDLGFPTANLSVEGDVLVPYGVYAADAIVKSPAARVCRAVVHYGPRPTFHERSPSLEAHLIGYSGNISQVRLRFLAFLRGVETFAGPDSLQRQLARDVFRARGLAALPASVIESESLAHA